MSISPETQALTERDKEDLPGMIKWIDTELEKRENQVALERGDVEIELRPSWELKEKLLRAIIDTYKKTGWHRVTATKEGTKFGYLLRLHFETEGQAFKNKLLFFGKVAAIALTCLIGIVVIPILIIVFLLILLIIWLFWPQVFYE